MSDYIPTQRKNRNKLPKKVIPLKNKDKSDHEKWYPGRDLIDFPSPFCMYICGPRNSGKSTLIKNILARKLYDEGYLYHFDGSNTQEYDDADLTILEDIPSNADIPIEGKKVFIMEDVPYTSLSPDQKTDLWGLLKYACSHKNMDIIITGHDFSTSVPPNIRRLFNVFILYKIPDINSLSVIGNKVGLKNNDMHELFQLCSNAHDNVTIDMTQDTPAPLRFNIYKKIALDDDNFS